MCHKVGGEYTRLTSTRTLSAGTTAVQIGDAGVVAAFISIVRGDSTVVSSSAPSYAVPSAAAAAAAVGSKMEDEEATAAMPGVRLVTYPVCVELQGKYTRGMTVVDQRAFVVPPDIPRGPENTQV